MSYPYIIHEGEMTSMSNGIDRRRLFIYTSAYITGALSGYFMLEKYKMIQAMALLIAGGLMYVSGYFSRRNAAICILFLISGFMIFTLNYIKYEASALTAESLQYGNITGVAISAVLKDGKQEFIITDSALTDDSGGDDFRLGRAVVYCRSGVCNCDGSDIADCIGRRIILRGQLQRPDGAANPGCFDYNLYLRSRGIGCIIRAETAELSDSEPRLKHLRLLIKIREAYLELFNNDNTRSFIKGIIFGDKSEIDEDIRNDFTENGTGHVLAVSGLHIGFVYSLILFLNGRRRTAASEAAAVIILILYGEMTMWNPSTLRAVMILCFNLLSGHVRRPFDLLTSVSASALLLLIYNPYQMLNSGFQMSFLTLMSISILSKPLSGIFGSYVGFIISVQAGILPISLYIFNRFNPLTALVNIPVIAVAAVIVPFCMILLLMSTITGGLPRICVTAADGLTEMLIGLNRELSMNGSYSFDTAISNPVWILLLYLIIFTFFSEWFRLRFFRREIKPVVFAVIMIITVCIVTGSACSNPFLRDRAVFVSVGQGSCIHLRTPKGLNILIDGGGSESYDMGSRILRPYLLRNGADKVEVALATHMDTDHYKGLEELNAIGMITTLVTNQDGYSSGDIIYQEEDFRITVLAPVADSISNNRLGTGGAATEETSMGLSTSEENENSLVFRIDWEDMSMIATGDIGQSTELQIIGCWADKASGDPTDESMKNILNADILAVPHHGSKNSSSEEFIEAVSPSVAVVQVGRNNMYGHPSPEALFRYESAGVRIYRNDTQGAVGVRVDDNRIKVHTESDID